MDPHTYTLWITVVRNDCRCSPGSCDSPKFYTSPRAVLDEFVGFGRELEAPDWMLQWPKTIRYAIRHHRGPLARLFMQLAVKRPNLSEVSAHHPSQ